MAKGDVALVAGAAGFLLGGLAVYLATSLGPRMDTVENVQRSDNETLAGLGAKLNEVDESVKGLSTRVSGLSSDPKALWDQIHALEAKVIDLQRQAAGVGGPRLERPADPPRPAPPPLTPPQNNVPPDTTIGPK